MGCGVAAAEEGEEEVEEDWQIILKVSQSETCRTTLAGEDKLQRGEARERNGGGRGQEQESVSVQSKQVHRRLVRRSRLSTVRCALIKAQMLPDAGGKEGEGNKGNARSIWRGRPYCFALME